MGKLSDKLNGLFKQVDAKEQRYEKALEQKEENLLVLQQEIQFKQIEVTDLHKMKLLGDITEETFDKQNQAFQLLQEKYNEMQKEVSLIQEYKRTDVVELLEELKATEKEHKATYYKEIQQMQMELLQAKAEYLNKLLEMKKRYDNTVEPVNNIQRLEQKLGLTQHVYTNGSHDGLNNIRVGEASYVSLRVDANEVFEALHSGEIDSRLQKIITDGLPE